MALIRQNNKGGQFKWVLINSAEGSVALTVSSGIKQGFYHCQSSDESSVVFGNEGRRRFSKSMFGLKDFFLWKFP